MNFVDVDEAYNKGELITYTNGLIRGLGNGVWKSAYCFYLLERSVVLDGDENFFAWAGMEFELSATNIERYANAWKIVAVAPDEIKPTLLKKNINAIIPFGTNLANGDISEADLDWNKIEKITHNAEARQLVREIKQIPERKGTVNLAGTTEEDGSVSIYAWHNGERFFIGFLKRPENEIEEKAVRRIINSSQIGVK